MGKPISKKKLENIRLGKGYNRRSIKEFVDFDYVDQLSQEEREWLAKFSGEYYGATFDANNEKNIHKSPEQKKEIYRTNNKRIVDITAKANSTFSNKRELSYLEEDLKERLEREEFEDEMIADFSEEKKKRRKKDGK